MNDILESGFMITFISITAVCCIFIFASLFAAVSFGEIAATGLIFVFLAYLIGNFCKW